MSDAERTRDFLYGMHVETDMNRMLERAIASLVERGKMTPEEAAAKRAELLPEPAPLVRAGDDE